MTQAPEIVATEAPSAAWVERLCADFARTAADLRGWRVDLWEGGVRIHLEVADQTAILDLHPRIEGPAFATTPSFTLYLRLPEGQTASGATSSVVSRLVARLREIDRGALTLPKGAQVPDPDAPEPRRPEALEALADWSGLDKELRQRLHLHSFIALKSLINDDLYPHIVLAKPVPEEEIQDSWRQTSRWMVEGRAPDKLGIYVHVPYCTVECSYCYCAKTEEFTRNDFDTYVERLIAEMEAYAPLVSGRTITSIYFGGGTPSLLSPPALRRVFETIYGNFNVPEGTQVIFEGNPDSLKPNKIEILAKVGRVTRLTMGIQTLDREVQRYVRRYNRKEDVEAAIHAAREYGIPHVNFDCIAGLQGQSMESFQNDINYLLSLRADSIHLNGFRPLPRTIYGTQGKALDPAQEALRDAMILWGEQALGEHGHTNTLEQGPHRTRNAANLQEYDLRKQNSSLLGFGHPARSHSFGGWYYMRDVAGGMLPSLQRQNAGARRYMGIRADLDEEMHKFLVTNIRGGFAEQEFRDLFRTDPRSVAPEGFRVLDQLGALESVDGRLLMHTGALIDSLLLRPFFYSDAMLQRAMEVWGKEYDPGEDYMAHLTYLVPLAD